MDNWDTPDALRLIDSVVVGLREFKVLEPGGSLPGDPVNLRGLSFPTVTSSRKLELPTVVVKRISGCQEFSEATLRRVDLSEARLDFSVWNNCYFHEVCFDSAKLRNVRFLGCEFRDCSFRSTDLSHASFSVGRGGAETELVNSTFEESDFRGASCHNPIFKDVRFIRCKLKGFVFESPLCDRVRFVGSYKELTFRGFPGDWERNRLRVDLTDSQICWLNANHGLDLTFARLPADDSCIVIADRLSAIEPLCNRLQEEVPFAVEVARVLRSIFSNRSISPLSADQTTFLVSRCVIKECDENLRSEQISEVFNKLRCLAEEEGFLAK